MKITQELKGLSDRIRTGLVQQYFVYFFVVFIIPVVIASVVIYGYSIRAMEDEARQSNKRILTSLSKIIDERIREAEELIQLKAHNSNIWGLMDVKGINYEFDNIAKTAGLLNDLSNSLLNRAYIDDVYVYFDSSDFVVSAKNGVYTFHDFFTYKNHYMGMNEQQFKDSITSSKGYRTFKTMKVTKNDLYSGGSSTTTRNIITMISRFPFSGKTKASIVVNIDENELFKSINSDINYDEDILVLNENYEKISYVGDKFLSVEQDEKLLSNIRGVSDNFEMDVDGMPTYVTYLTSDYKDWKYVALIPMKLLTKKSEYIRTITVVVCLLFLVMGLFTSILLSRKIYNPIKEISKRLAGYFSPSNLASNSNGNEFNMINSSLNSLFTENSRLYSIYEVSKELVMEKIFYRIIKGDIGKHEEFQKEKDLYNISFPSEVFVPIHIKIDYFNKIYMKMTEDEKRLIHRKVKNFLNSLLKDKGVVLIELEDNQFCAVLFLTQYEEAELKQITSTLMIELKSYAEHMDANMAVGNVLSDFLDINQQYRQLQKLVHNRVFGIKNQVLYLWEIELISEEEIHISMEQKKQLQNALLNGDYKYSVQLVCKLIEKCVDMGLRYKPVKMIFMDILNNVLSAVEEAGYKTYEVFENYYTLYEQLEGANNQEQLEQFFSDIFICISNYVQNKKVKNEENTIKQLLDEIHNHYEKPLSLDYMADKMGLSSSYFSSYFKEKVGENFVEYLNKVRINKAKQLLRETELKIMDISEKVGYSSCNTFNIVFKKYEGISPGTYKKNLTEILEN